MARRTVDHAGIRYTVSMDGAIPEGGLASAIVFARVVDELTGQPPQARVAIETTFAGLQPRSAGDGLVGFSAIPRIALTQLRTQAYNIPVRLSASHYLDTYADAVIGPQATFPNAFAPVDLGEIELHREGVVLRGRVGEPVGLDIVGIAGADIRVIGIWRSIPGGAVPPPADAPNVISLLQGAYFGRTLAAARVRRRAMTPVPADERVLTTEARAGSDVLRVSNRIGVAAGQIILIEADASRREYMTVASVAGAASPDGEAVLTLTFPLRRAHAEGTLVQRVTPQAPGADNLLTAEPIPGDVCLLCATLTDLGVPEVVEIHGGPNPPEFHLMSRFAVVSDASGFYRLPPLSRVAQLEIEVNDGVHAPLLRTFQPEYELVENRLDFTLL